MKFTVNESCIGCGICEGLCPEVFKMNADGMAEAVPEEVDDESVLDTANQAMDECPAGAIVSE